MAEETATDVETEELWGASHPTEYPCISLQRRVSRYWVLPRW